MILTMEGIFERTLSNWWIGFQLAWYTQPEIRFQLTVVRLQLLLVSVNSWKSLYTCMHECDRTLAYELIAIHL